MTLCFLTDSKQNEISKKTRSGQSIQTHLRKLDVYIRHNALNLTMLEY